MSNLSEFLSEHKISTEALLSASAAAERHGPADRDTLLKREKARAAKKSYAELALTKPKGRGRGLSPDVLARAVSGQPVPRLVRSKITRAVNEVLAKAKKDAIDWRPLFADVRARKGESKKK